VKERFLIALASIAAGIGIVAITLPRPQAARAQTSMQTPWVYSPRMEWFTINPPLTSIGLKFPPALAPAVPGAIPNATVFPLFVFLDGKLAAPNTYTLTGSTLSFPNGDPGIAATLVVYYWYGTNAVGQ
jgi:hypothetical protein